MFRELKSRLILSLFTNYFSCPDTGCNDNEFIKFFINIERKNGFRAAIVNTIHDFFKQSMINSYTFSGRYGDLEQRAIFFTDTKVWSNSLQCKL